MATTNSILPDETWAELRAASIRGVSDQKLSEVYGVKPTTISSRRYNDREWRLARSDGALPEKVRNSNSNIGQTNRLTTVLEASLEEIATENPLLLSRYTHQKIKEAVQGNMLPDIQDWSQLKTASEILRKAVGLDREAASVTLNLFGGGDSGFEETPVLDGFCESVETSIETQEGPEEDFC
jgi:hypothetical protein